MEKIWPIVFFFSLYDLIFECIPKKGDMFVSHWDNGRIKICSASECSCIISLVCLCEAKRNSLKYVVQLVRVWKSGIRCCVGYPPPKAKYTSLIHILANLAALLTTVYVHFKIVFLYEYIWIYSKSQELLACCGASNSWEQKGKSAFREESKNLHDSVGILCQLPPAITTNLTPTHNQAVSTSFITFSALQHKAKLKTGFICPEKWANNL